MREYALNQADQEFHGLLFGNFRRNLRNWFKRRMLRQVRELNDYMLKDIGISRADLADVLELSLRFDPVMELERRLERRRRVQEH